MSTSPVVTTAAPRAAFVMTTAPRAASGVSRAAKTWTRLARLGPALMADMDAQRNPRDARRLRRAGEAWQALAECHDGRQAERHHFRARAMLALANALLRILDPWGMTPHLLASSGEQDDRAVTLARQASPPPDHPRTRARRLIAAPMAPPAASTGCAA